MIIVRFNDPEEFAAELTRGKPKNGILRVMKEFKYSGRANTRHISVLSSFIRYDDPAGNGEIIKLDNYCGEYWPNGDRKALDRAEDAIRDLEDAAKRLGIEVRAGVYEETK
jgi:hypothetical protein